MRTTTVILALTLLATPLFASERYMNEKLNFSIATPGDDWKWTPIPDDGSDGVFAVTGPHGDRFSIAVSQVGRYRLSEDWIVELQRDVRRDAMSNGFRIEEFSQQRAGSPIFPSFTYSYVRVDASGKKCFVEGYIGATNRIYTLQYASYDHELMPEFRSFIASFQVADHLEAQRAPNTRTGTDIFPGTSRTGMTTALGVAIAPNAVSTPPATH
jgi:hypothetical protein